MSPTAPLRPALVVWALASLATAQTVDLEPSKDNTLYEDVAGGLSNGAGPVLFAGRVRANGGGATRRAVLAFDVAGSVPAGATILAAELSLVVTQSSAFSTHDFALHRLSADWGEGTSSTTSGIGAPSTANDATWIHRFYPSSGWSSAGGDFVAGASATATVGSTGTVTWTSAGLAADAQSWLDAPAGNFGWILIGDESVLQTARKFGSREDTVAANRPVLSITYALPCATAAAVGTRNAGANPLTYTALPATIGGTFQATVDNGAVGQTTAFLIAFDTPFSFPLADGQVLLCGDAGSGELFTGTGLAPGSSAGGIDTFTAPVPDVPGLCGLELCTQAIQLGSPPFVLSNAQDLTIGQ